MHNADLTMTEALHDPMIRLLLRADRVSLGDFARLMEHAARARNARHQDGDATAPPASAH